MGAKHDAALDGARGIQRRRTRTPRRRAPGARTRACRMAEGPGLRPGQRAVTLGEPPA